MKTVSRRFGMSTLTSLRLFSRAPTTRIRSWLSATCVPDPAALAVPPVVVSAASSSLRPCACAGHPARSCHVLPPWTGGPTPRRDAAPPAVRQRPAGARDRFGTGLRTSTRQHGGLLLVGTEQHEPWHLAAHLSEDARRAGVAELVPTLVRHHVPDGAPRTWPSGWTGSAPQVGPPPCSWWRPTTSTSACSAARRRPPRAGRPVRGAPRRRRRRRTGPRGARRDGRSARRPARRTRLLDTARSLEVVQHLVSVTATDPRGDRAAGRLAALRAALGRRERDGAELGTPLNRPPRRRACWTR